jgi:hypothetical protein
MGAAGDEKAAMKAGSGAPEGDAEDSKGLHHKKKVTESTVGSESQHTTKYSQVHKVSSHQLLKHI